MERIDKGTDNYILVSFMSIRFTYTLKTKSVGVSLTIASSENFLDSSHTSTPVLNGGLGDLNDLDQ